MLKRSMVLFTVIVLLLSFSALAFAQADNNNAGVNVFIEDGSGQIEFLDAVPDLAEDNPSETESPSNPILVAGN